MDEIRDVGELGAELVRALAPWRRADAEDVDERAAGVAHRLEHPLEAAPPLSSMMTQVPGVRSALR